MMICIMVSVVLEDVCVEFLRIIYNSFVRFECIMKLSIENLMGIVKVLSLIS